MIRANLRRAVFVVDGRMKRERLTRQDKGLAEELRQVPGGRPR